MQFAQRLRDTADEELVTPLETFEAAAHREPDLAEELDRGDESAEAEVDEDTPSPAQQRQLLRAHVNLVHPAIGEFNRALRNGRCRRRVVRWVKRYFKCQECEARPMPRSPARSSFVEMLPSQSSLWHRYDGSSESVGSRKPNLNVAPHLSRDTLPPGRTQARHDSHRDFLHIATVLAQTL